MTAGSAVVIRVADPADAEALGHCHVACWREAYAGMVPADRLAAATAAVQERIERWRQILTDFPDRLLAEDAGAVVGIAAAGPHRDPELGLDLELYAIYVRQAYWGTGLGHRLLGAAVGEADASLWVLRENARARRFYAAHGFRADGTEKVEPYFDRVEIRMVRRRPGPGSS